MTFRVTVFVLLGAAFSTTLAAADNRPEVNPPAISTPPPPQFAPMTRSERFSHYLVGLANGESFVLAVASAGIGQAKATPKEWGGGAEGFGEARRKRLCGTRDSLDFAIRALRRAA